MSSELKPQDLAFNRFLFFGIDLVLKVSFRLFTQVASPKKERKKEKFGRGIEKRSL